MQGWFVGFTYILMFVACRQWKVGKLETTSMLANLIKLQSGFNVIWFRINARNCSSEIRNGFLCGSHLGKFLIRNGRKLTWSDSLFDINSYPMLRADSRFWLVNNCEIWSRISLLTSSGVRYKDKGTSLMTSQWRFRPRRPLSLPLRYDLAVVTLCFYGDLGQINVIAGIFKLRKRLRMSQILFEHGINSLPFVCFRGYGILSTLSIAIPRLAFGRAWFCNAARQQTRGN